MILLSEKSIGDLVKLKVNGTAREFIVVHKGKPSTIYDDSFNNGVILLMKELYESRQWHSSTVNDYANSTLHSYLNGTFLNLIDADIRNQIVQVKVPYRPESGTSQTVNSGDSGLAAKIFLLAGYEMNWTSSTNQYFPADGTTLSYFSGTEATGSKNIAYLSGTATRWWLRSPFTNNSTSAWYVNTDGTCSSSYCSNNYGIRPALVLPSSLFVSDDGNIVINQLPTAPDGITLPAIRGGQPAPISWGASTDTDGTIFGYKLERSVNGDTFSQIYQGIYQTITDNITFGWNTVQYRVRAYDNMGEESGYTTSALTDVINSSPPVIDGSDSDLGMKTGSFSQTYTVTNPDAGITKTLTVAELIDGREKRTFTATSGTTNSFDVTAAEWREILNGSHTLTITVTDNFGDTAVREYTFSKNETQIDIILSEPFPTDEMVTKAAINIVREIPAGAIFTIEACNNGFDDEPTWEDVTNKVVGGQKFFFTNTTKTADNWGVNFRVRVNRNGAIGNCYIQGIGGNFE